MDTPKLVQKILLAALLALSAQLSIGQVQIRGTIYDRTRQFAMPGVSVLTTSGGGTVTDSVGNYSIRMHTEDSIYFSYLGRFTMRFPVKNVSPDQAFDMSLQVAVDSLPLVVVRPKDYRTDSAQNRDEYRKIFEYGGGDYLSNSSGAGVGVNLDALFEMRKIRRMEAFQRRLLEEERDKYVDHRFTKTLVRKLTGLKSPALDTFMREYRPSYEFIQNCENDYEYYKYIRDWGRSFAEQWKQDHPE
jgi:hypothetical protein